MVDVPLGVMLAAFHFLPIRWPNHIQIGPYKTIRPRSKGSTIILLLSLQQPACVVLLFLTEAFRTSRAVRRERIAVLHKLHGDQSCTDTLAPLVLLSPQIHLRVD